MAILKRSSMMTSSSSSSSSSTTTKTSKQKVSFDADSDEIHTVDRFENKQDLWFARYDEFAFRERDVAMIKMISDKSRHHHYEHPEQEVEQQTGESTRGLEFHSQPEFRRAVQLRRTSSMAAVVARQAFFEKQQCQKHQQQKIAETIARAYGLVSKSAALSARERGSCDARYVEEYVRTDLNLIMMMSRLFETQQQKVHLQHLRITMPTRPSTCRSFLTGSDDLIKNLRPTAMRTRLMH